MEAQDNNYLHIYVVWLTYKFNSLKQFNLHKMYVPAVTDVQRDKMQNGLLIFQTVTHILCISSYNRAKRIKSKYLKNYFESKSTKVYV